MADSERGSGSQIRHDRALVRRLLAGDETAFERFFDDYFGGLYRFALTRLDHDEELSREVVQSTVLKAIEKLDTYRGEAALFTWLCSICRWEISGHFRKAKREPVEQSTVPIEPGEPMPEDRPELQAVLAALAAGETGPEEALRHKEVVRLVHLTLDHLPPHYGRALEWKYLQGLPVKDIAKRLELSPKAAESVLTRAREAFRTGFTALSRTLGEGFQGLRPAPVPSPDPRSGS